MKSLTTTHWHIIRDLSKKKETVTINQISHCKAVKQKKKLILKYTHIKFSFSRVFTVCVLYTLDSKIYCGVVCDLITIWN